MTAFENPPYTHSTPPRQVQNTHDVESSQTTAASPVAGDAVEHSPPLQVGSATLSHEGSESRPATSCLVDVGDGAVDASAQDVNVGATATAEAAMEAQRALEQYAEVSALAQFAA